MADINWELLREKLPFEKTPEAKQIRKDLFSQFDPNGNGYLSLAEVDKGMRDVLQSEELFGCKQAVNRSFHYAKKIAPSDGKHGPDFLEWPEFRIFLMTLRQYFEYYQAFNRLDSDDDDRVSKEEFCSDKVKETITVWVGEIEDMEAEFDAIDKNGGGQILFDEFVEWATAKNLDIEEDDD